MRIANASTMAFKIGWAFDFRMRERTFNQSALPALGGLRYQTVLQQLWDTAMQAFEMEQALLRHFDSARHKTNREGLTGIPLEVIQLAWVNFMRHRRTH
jgi:hypothetical protein